MKYLGFNVQELTDRGAIHTAKEISQQPEIWQKVWSLVEGERESIQSFFDKHKEIQRIILTGAGTSAFIGLSLRGVFQRQTGILTEAISTTDLVSHPKDYLHADVPTLMISFARSGNSPESVAAVEMADKVCKSCYHLMITCNPEGKLANIRTKQDSYILTLPEEACDLSLAMTSSYTGMLLAGKLVAHIYELERMRKSLQTIVTYGQKIINYYAQDLKQLAELDFRRAVFLGAGPFYGTATESHLKVQELTDGKVICKRDSFLGLRHGPKAVVDETTLVVYIFSNNDYPLRYEKDLVASMKKGKAPLAEVGIMESDIPNVKLKNKIVLSENGYALDEEFLAVCSVVPSQILGFYKSLQLGLQPDSPSATGAITRVVEGVEIYAMH
ncbi:SIS domain-containing protein [Cesiribacter sp. SM1]|uniref:SIS domain-containing protein n=1 Tax=Cesiribacter sp. SM1 TaxID=2861196 RepID=UPI001CD220DA|nr:SIS domain-containing protein [Cesiribacter sp. SM1]